jgi:hypothetical protein
VTGDIRQRLAEHRHGQPPGGVLACQPSWHGTCRHCGGPIALIFEPGGHPIWLHDNAFPASPYSACPTTHAEPAETIEAQS